MPRSDGILIVGGSLAGLMLALALANAGRESLVLERAPLKRRSGAALAIDERALHRVLGAEHTQRVLDVAAPDQTSRRSAIPVSWAALHAGLRTAAEADPRIELRHNVRITDVGQDNESAWALSDNGHRYTGDAVVGADGHRSIVRAHVTPHHPDARFAGYVLWLGIADEADINIRGPWPTGLDIRNSDGHFLLGYPLAGRSGLLKPGSRRLGWAWYDAGSNELFRKAGSVRGSVVHHSLAAGDIPTSQYEQLAAQAKRFWPSPWKDAVLDGITRRQVTGTPIAEYVPDRLANGRLAIIGDAAHVPTPMTGSGFGESLDDAGALASALDGIPGHRSIPEAFKAYEHERLLPARDLVLSGQRFSQSFRTES
jgi:2-polyprenyl-6-methoxyphenol hydroxylase-like FAD-dependent oxidoreductase